LVKLFHPDSNQETANHEQIIRNAAYEVLRDATSRQSYDQELSVRPLLPGVSDNSKGNRPKQYRAIQTGRDADEQLEQWLQQVYQPVNLLYRILSSQSSKSTN